MNCSKQPFPVIQKVNWPFAMERSVRYTEPLQNMAVFPTTVEADLGHFGDYRPDRVRFHVELETRVQDASRLGGHTQDFPLGGEATSRREVRAEECVDIRSTQQAELHFDRDPSGTRRPDGSRNRVLVSSRITYDPGGAASHREKVLRPSGQ